jgi:hypothetical protein
MFIISSAGPWVPFRAYIACAAISVVCAGLPPAAAIPSPAAGSVTGSAYVPVESWVYPVLDRLAGLGYIPSQIAGLRPWSRGECRRQMREAEEVLKRHGDLIEPGVHRLLEALHREFDSREDGTGLVVIESIYFRAGGIAGAVLNDSYHFGQTRRDDLGRPFGAGAASNTGFAARAERGRVFAAVRGEHQHAPGADAYSPAIGQLIRGLDNVPELAGLSGGANVNRFRALEAYAGVQLGNVAISVGKQSLYWGPGAEAPLSFSSNAEPTRNLKVATMTPVVLPGLLRHLGAIRGEFVIGKLGGHAYTWQPWFNAQKVSFKLTENLETGFTRWSIFWGVGHPATIGSFARNFTSLTSAAANSHTDPRDPGDRKAGFDFRYRVPKVRKWLTLYCDSYSEDDPSPLAAPRRAAMSPGIWVTKIPGVPNLDFRVDVASTTPFGGDQGGQFNYYNAQYRSGNTNYGFLLGNPAGRNGRAATAGSTYRFTARTLVEASYRQQKTSAAFLPGGGTQTDAAIRAAWAVAPNWYASASVQAERFWIPALGGPKRNLSALMQLTWEPQIQVFQSRR